MIEALLFAVIVFACSLGSGFEALMQEKKNG